MLHSLYLADACHRSDHVMCVLSGVLQCSNKRKLLLKEELVVLLYASEGILYLIHVFPFLDLGREGERASCLLDMMQFCACSFIFHLSWNCVG